MLMKQKLLKDPEKFLYEENFFAYVCSLEEAHELKKLPQNLYVYHVLNTLSAEVNNGGFAQFLTNSSCLVYEDLLPCAKLLGNRELTKLISDFTEEVDAYLKKKDKKIEERDYEDDFLDQLERYDDRFDSISKVDEKILSYYKDHLEQKTITYEAVREKESDSCAYFVLGEEAFDPRKTAESLFSFLEEFGVTWDMTADEFRLSFAPDRDCLDLDELLRHFADATYSFSSHSSDGKKHERACLAGIGFLKFVSMNPADPDHPNYRSNGCLKIAASGFGEGEYKMKKMFHAGWIVGSFLDERLSKPFFSASVSEFPDPKVQEDKKWKALLKAVKEEEGNHPCVASFREEKMMPGLFK